MIKKYIEFYKKYLYGFAKSQLLGMLILFVYSITNIIYPYFLKLIIDDAIFNKDFEKLLLYTIIMVITIVISIVFRYIKNCYFFNLGKTISLHIKERIITKIFQYNFSFFRKYKTGEIVSILEQDVYSIQTLFTNIASDILVNMITFFGLLIILFILNLKIALIALLLSVIYLFFQSKFGKKIKLIAYETSVKRGDFQAVSQEIISNIPNIQLNNQIEYFKDRYKECQNRYYNVQFQGMKVKAKFGMLDGSFEAANLILVLFFGGYMVLGGDLTVGSLFTLTLYVQKLFNPIIALMNDYLEIKKAQASIDRIYEILDDNQCQIKAGNINLSNANSIIIKNFDFAYNHKHLFSNINLIIEKGDKIALIGENGSGKTTFMNVILKLEDYVDGVITLNGFNIKEFDHSYYDNILLIKQNPFIFTGSILENLLMGNKDTSFKQVNNVLELVNLKEDIELMKDGLNTIVGEKGIMLSGGQSQKLALARIFLLHDYPVIILDEPSSALDLESEKIILKNIFKYKAKATIIVVTHREEALKYCNKIMEIRNNKISLK